MGNVFICLKGMKFLLPLSLFQVRYEVGAGRPYSELDKLVLRAVGEGATTLTDLQNVFLLRGRLLIESLITLARAGWIAIDVTNGGFRTTAVGTNAIKDDQVPKFTVIQQLKATIILETVTGELISQQEMKPYLSKPDIISKGLAEHYKYLSPDYFNHRLDPGQVSDLLDRRAEEWIRWIDIPEIASRDYHWLPLIVDLESMAVHNLPERWRRSLGPVLIKKAAALESKPISSRDYFTKTLKEPSVEEGFPETFSAEDLLLSRSDHFNAFKRALLESKTTVFVASAFFDTSQVDSGMRNAILSALRRGVTVFFLWGYAIYHGKLSEKEALSWLRDLRKEAGEYGKNLRFNDVSLRQNQPVSCG
jgi:hypothetical protein